MKLNYIGVLCVVIFPTSAWGEDCQAFLKRVISAADPTDISAHVFMVTMNKNGVASFTETRLYYSPAWTERDGTKHPGEFKSLDAGVHGTDNPKFFYWRQCQVFSDRYPRLTNFDGEGSHEILGQTQRFDARNADDLKIEITDTPIVTVTVTACSWGNVQSSFTPVLDGGLMIGGTSDVKYIIFMAPWFTWP